MSVNTREKRSITAATRGPQAQVVDREREPTQDRPDTQYLDRTGLSESDPAYEGVEPVDSKSRSSTVEDVGASSAVAVIRQRTRRSFITGGLAALAAAVGWRWLRTRREDEELAWPLRLSHRLNEELSRDYFSRNRLAPTFPAHMASEPRIHGTYGLDEEDFDPTDWKLAVVGLSNPRETDSDEADLFLTLEEIKQLPRVEIVTQMKCIEGWSVIVRWAGVRLADLIEKYPPLTKTGEDPDVLRRPDDLVGYVGLETPDGEYYVSIDMESALHPQTLLCYEMNGQPLSLKHGAPLRLVTAVKYGIKNIKRIGKITYTNKLPADYWAERGYDWYSGH